MAPCCVFGALLLSMTGMIVASVRRVFGIAKPVDEPWERPKRLVSEG